MIICLCQPKAVEQQSSRRHYICFFIDSVSAKTENTSILAVRSGRHYVSCLWLFSPWWSKRLFTLSTLKNCNVMYRGGLTTWAIWLQQATKVPVMWWQPVVVWQSATALTSILTLLLSFMF